VLRQGRGQARFFWQEANENVTFAGFGTAVDLRAWGESRFTAVQQQIHQLFANAILTDSPEPWTTPRLFGGFAFSDSFTPDNTWAVFHPAQFILPHYQLTQVAADTWLTLNVLIAADEHPHDLRPQLEAALTERIELLQTETDTAVSHDTAVSPIPPLQQITYPMPYPTWEQIIQQATALMHNGPLNKVVLSRVCELWFNGRIPIIHILQTLNQTYPDCHRFLFEPLPHHAFYGATPELLLRVNGRSLTTMALAGSIRRGQTAVEDATLAHELLHSRKDRHEHDLVVQSIQRRLAHITTELHIPPEPGILQLGYIQHLHTPIHGRLSHTTGILPILEQLHPTPALGGSPRELALDFINQAEPVPRGWYAAPIGWIDPHQNGAFAVAIRSAIAQDRRVWLHAGAGIVADSNPQKEWDETALKFKPMLNALHLELNTP
jgi:menaquinone-specific isochorismate synthase